ncbi:hypothetical protein PM082_022423 [Marasmius tenuissimus]|nr:hypothetical protein PM082_022423 [Marasmius tenuissimus]
METLSLSLVPNYTSSTWVMFINQITLPWLSSLTLQKYSLYDEIVDISPLLRCISRSSCPITSLTIGYNTFRRVQLYHDLLSLVPGLTSLFAHGNEGHSPQQTLLKESPAKDFLNLLLVSPNTTNGETSPHLLPRLRSIALDLDYTDEDLEIIYEVVKSRWKPGRETSSQVVDCLRSVTITSPYLPEPSHLEKLRKLDDEGLEVFINVAD